MDIIRLNMYKLFIFLIFLTVINKQLKSQIDYDKLSKINNDFQRVIDTLDYKVKHAEQINTKTYNNKFSEIRDEMTKVFIKNVIIMDLETLIVSLNIDSSHIDQNVIDKLKSINREIKSLISYKIVIPCSISVNTYNLLKDLLEDEFKKSKEDSVKYKLAIAEDELDSAYNTKVFNDSINKKIDTIISKAWSEDVKKIKGNMKFGADIILGNERQVILCFKLDSLVKKYGYKEGINPESFSEFKTVNGCHEFVLIRIRKAKN